MTENLSKIDALIAAARQRKAAREAAGEDAPAPEKKQRVPKAAKEPKEPKAKKEKVVDEEAVAQKAAERAQRKAQIEQDRAVRLLRQAWRAERDANKPKRAAHMSKLERAEAKLPPMTGMAHQEYNDIIVNFSRGEIAALALWLQHYNRAAATERAVSAKLEIGDQVTITGGDPKWIGKTGTVSEVRRIRCFVEVEGVAKPIYLFTSDVARNEAELQATGTEG
jgi:hypothetical protein